MNWLITETNALAPTIEAGATVVLAVITSVYAWLTKRMVDEMARQNRPYIFLKLDEADQLQPDLLLVNTGSRVARDITIRVVRDAAIRVRVWENGFSEEPTKVSELEKYREGVPSLPPQGRMTLGFVELRNPKMTRQRLEYVARYSDGAGHDYEESLTLEYWC